MVKGNTPSFGDAGTALWRSLTAEYEMSNLELAVLTAACRQLDDIVLLEGAIESDGATVSGSAGQPRLNAALTEVRQGRLALAKLLGALAVPDDDDRPLSESARRAQHAANTRWTRHRAARDRAGLS